MTKHEIHCIVSYLQERLPRMVNLLQRLAMVESPSDNPAAVAPLLAMFESELEQSGMSVRRFQGRTSAGMLFARPCERTAKSPLQMLIGHCDTVWPVGTIKQMPVRVDGELLRGPGVFDMKGGLVQMLYALRALKDLRLRPPADIVVVINSDEEIGSPDSTRLIRRLARRALRAFVLEPAYGRTGKLKTARKSSGSFTITITGKAAHAGVSPEEGASAILEMSYQIQKLFALNDAGRGITVNVGTIDGGLRPNVVAAEVQANVDVRVRTRHDAAEVQAAIRSLRPVNPKTTIRVEGQIDQPPMEPLPRNQALWRLAQDFGRRLGMELDQTEVGGVSDGNTTSQYTATLDGLGAVGEGAHAHHEQVLIPKMVERCALLVLLLLAPLASGSPEAAEQALTRVVPSQEQP